jgi:hypothetical protein
MVEHPPSVERLDALEQVRRVVSADTADQVAAVLAAGEDVASAGPTVVGWWVVAAATAAIEGVFIAVRRGPEPS